MDKAFVWFLIFFCILDLVPAVVDFVGKQRSEELSFEKLIVKVLQGLSINFDTFISKLQKILRITENNFCYIFFLLFPLSDNFISD